MRRSASRHSGDLLLGQLLVHLTDLHASDGLEEAGTVRGARERLVLEHLLCDLTVELGARVSEVRLHVDELLQLVELAVHFHHGHLRARTQRVLRFTRHGKVYFAEVPSSTTSCHTSNEVQYTLDVRILRATRDRQGERKASGHPTFMLCTKAH